MEEQHFKFSASVVSIPFMLVVLLWIVFWADIRFHLNLEAFGIYPRTLSGIRGVFLSPFIHGNLEHLYNNSIPLLILIAALRFFYRDLTFPVLGYGILLTGLITWVIGRSSFHIGASGMVYLLVSFIFFKGVRSGYYRLIALSLVVILIYGSLVWYVFPNVEEGISWEGHLAGLFTGFVFATLMKTPDYKKIVRYEWEHPDYDPSQDKFMQRFDENGNFVNPPKPEPEISAYHADPISDAMQPMQSTHTQYEVFYDVAENKYVIKQKNQPR